MKPDARSHDSESARREGMGSRGPRGAAGSDPPDPDEDTAPTPALMEQVVDLFDAFVDYVLTLLRFHQATLATGARSFARRIVMVFAAFMLGAAGLCLLTAALIDWLTMVTGTRAAALGLTGGAYVAIGLILFVLAKARTKQRVGERS